MDRLGFKEKITEFLNKYKYAVIVLLIGLGLLLLPSGDKERETESITTPQGNILSVEDSLAEILSTVQGAGKVRVLLTVAYGEETLYQSDTSGTGSNETGSGRSDTVIITGTDRNEQGLIRQIIPPVYQGAIVVCQGADSPAVRLNIVEAVSKATGLSTDKITVLKMK